MRIPFNEAGNGETGNRSLLRPVTLPAAKEEIDESYDIYDMNDGSLI